MRIPTSEANRQFFLGLAVVILVPFLVWGMAKGPWTVTDAQVVWFAYIVRTLAFIVIVIVCFDTISVETYTPWWLVPGLLLPAPCLVMLIIHALPVKQYPATIYSDLFFACVTCFFWFDLAEGVERIYPSPVRPPCQLLPLPEVTPPPVVPQPPVVYLPPPMIARVRTPAPLPPAPVPNTAELEIDQQRKHYEAAVAEVKAEGVGRDPALVAEQLKYLRERFDQKVKEIRR